MPRYKYTLPDWHPTGELVGRLIHRSPNGSSNYHHVTLDFVYINPDNPTSVDKGYSDDYIRDVEADVFVTEDGTLCGQKFAASCIGHTDERELTGLLAILVGVRKNLESYAREWGEPDSCGQFYLRICKALGLTQFVMGYRQGDQEYHLHQLADLPYCVERELALARQDRTPA